MSGPRKKTPAKPPSNSAWLWAFIAALVVGLGVWLFWPKDVPKGSATSSPPTSAADREFAEAQKQKEILSAYAGSQSCQKCHAEAFATFQNSHHAQAERPVDMTTDKSFFEPSRTIKHGSQTSEAQMQGQKLALIAAGPHGATESFPLTRVIGVEPLRQFLTPIAGGRFQVTELAVDPVRHDWFDIFGNDDRRPGEWGHWTGRGMNWNNMCASCHNTRVLKNYDDAADTYSTAMAEPTVGCEACHGPLAKHVQWQKSNPGAKHDPTVSKLTRDQIADNCGSCHARRGELTGNFQPGDKFFDHFFLTIADDTEIYYPDGQVHEEDYEFASFLGSKMYHSGVRCIDCHEPHSAKTRFRGDALCLSCHGTPIAPAPKIDPIAHSHHKADTEGSHCVDCHMPQTNYMQRHARRDHGFTIPDPLLTKKFQIPNACNRCHKDHDVDWSLASVEKWYGSRMERSTRQRAEAIAEARAGNDGARDKLLAILPTEKIAAWRSTELILLRNWTADPKVQSVFLEHARDTNAIVRAVAARALEPLASVPNHAAAKTLSDLTADPVRNVRVEAAWALRATIDTHSSAGRELLHYLTFNLDQPSGALQMGNFYFDRGDATTALTYFQRALNWDTNSAPLHHALAVALSASGQTDRAIGELKTACKLAPNDAEYHFKLGLAQAESGNIAQTITELETAVRLNPQFGQAWYNLGLAHASDQPEIALHDLARAETLEPNSARAPYARATVLLRLGRTDDARKAALRTLEIEPNFTEAANLANSIRNQ